MSMTRKGGQQGRAGIGRLVVAGALAAAAVVVGPIAGTAQAAGVGGIAITEVAPWGSGDSPYSADWFEVTNTGAVAVNVTGWKMDDSSNSSGSAVAMTGITSIAPGESVIYFESSTAATTIASFKSAWWGASPPSGLQFGTYSGSGVGLGTGGDAVNLYNSSNALQANVSFGASPSSAPFATFDNAAAANNTAIATLSVAGVNGAFLVPTPASQAAIGSPGTIVGAGAGAPLPGLAKTGLPLLVGAAMLGGFVVLNDRRRTRQIAATPAR